MPIIVEDLWIYPVKSLRGNRVSSIECTKAGIQDDRRWMVVRPDGTFVTQREVPRMATIEVTYLNALRLKASDGCTCCVGVEDSMLARLMVVHVWEDLCFGKDQGDTIARWLTNHLGTDVRLVLMSNDDDEERLIKNCDPNEKRTLGFADGHQGLLASMESLRELNARIRESGTGNAEVPMDRFRANIVVSGMHVAFDEDRLRSFKIGGVQFSHAGGCCRCPVTTTDQATGERGPEPMRTLAAFRTRPRDKDGKKKVFFGTNLRIDTPGTVRVGDVLTDLVWNETPIF